MSSASPSSNSTLAYSSLASIAVCCAYLWPKDPPPLAIVWSISVLPLADLLHLWLLEHYSEQMSSVAIDGVSMVVAIVAGTFLTCLVQQRQSILLLITVAYALFVMNVSMAWWYGLTATAAAVLVWVLATTLKIGDRIFYTVYALAISALLLWQISLFTQLIHYGEAKNMLAWWMFLIYAALVTCRLMWVYRWQWSQRVPAQIVKRTKTSSSARLPVEIPIIYPMPTFTIMEESTDSDNDLSENDFDGLP